MLKQFGEVTEEDRDLGFNLISLTIGGKTTSRIIVFFPKEKRPELEQMVRIEFKSVGEYDRTGPMTRGTPVGDGGHRLSHTPLISRTLTCI